MGKSHYNIYFILFVIIVIILVLCVQYHNYCTDNKLRHTIFGALDYFHIVDKKICHTSLLQKKEENALVVWHVTIRHAMSATRHLLQVKD